MKYIILFLIYINECYGYINLTMLNNNFKNNNKILRRKIINSIPLVPLVPLLYLRSVNAENEKTMEELREEANRIIEIIEVQKSKIDLPILKNKDIENIESNNNIKNTNENINTNVEYILNNILINFKNKNPDEALTFLKKQSSPSNMVKNTDNIKLKILFDNSKYGILFGKFESYNIENYYKTIEEELDNTEYYTVDVRIKASYNIMINNGIQFNDMYYPKENDKYKLCSIIYRWTFRKMSDNNYLLESCYLVSRQ